MHVVLFQELEDTGEAPAHHLGIGLNDIIVRKGIVQSYLTPDSLFMGLLYVLRILGRRGDAGEEEEKEEKEFHIIWFQDSEAKGLVSRFKFQVSSTLVSSFKIQVSSYLFFKPVMELSFREVMNLLIDLLRLRVSLYSFLAVSLSMKPTSEALII